MGNKRRETTRGKTKSALQQCSNKLTDAGVLLGEPYRTYNQHHSEFAEAFKQLIEIITMVQAMVIDIKDKL